MKVEVGSCHLIDLRSIRTIIRLDIDDSDSKFESSIVSDCAASVSCRCGTPSLPHAAVAKMNHVTNQVPCQYDRRGPFTSSFNRCIHSFSYLRNRDYPPMSSSRNGGYSSGGGGGGGGPDRSYPSLRNSYIDGRSRPYESPYERQRMLPPLPMAYADAYSMRAGPMDRYERESLYHQRLPQMSLADPYGRGPPMRYVVDRVL